MPTETPYPVPVRKPFCECPVHLLVVPVDERGRLAGSCPACRREAEAALPLVARSERLAVSA